MKQLKHLLLALACALPIVGLSHASQDEAMTAGERYEALEEEVDEAYAAWRKEMMEIRKAAEAGETTEAISMVPPYGQFVPKFQAAAADYIGTEDAVPFLSWIAMRGMNADEEAGKAALKMLLGDHVKSEGLLELSYMLPRLEDFFGEQIAGDLLANVEAQSPLPGMKAWAVFARLGETLEKSDVGSDAYEAAKREMQAAMQGLDDRYLASEVGQLTTVREKFSIGMVAPDIVGIDLDGAAFKLSDYKGKVLFVDFWGDW